MINKELKFFPDKKAPLANCQAYRCGEQTEVCKVFFKSADPEYIMTLKCIQHLECNCAINSMLKLLSKRFKKSGPVLKIEKYITRRLFNHNKYIDAVYGLVDPSVDHTINDMFYEIVCIKNKTLERTSSTQIAEITAKINKYQREQGHLTNSYLSHYIHPNPEENYYSNYNQIIL